MVHETGTQGVDCAGEAQRGQTRIFRIILSIDPNAFVSQTRASGVFGYGFDRIKLRANANKDRAEIEKMKAKVASDQAASSSGKKK